MGAQRRNLGVHRVNGGLDGGGGIAVLFPAVEGEVPLVDQALEQQGLVLQPGEIPGGHRGAQGHDGVDHLLAELGGVAPALGPLQGVLELLLFHGQAL